MLSDILSKIVPIPGMKDAEMMAALPTATKAAPNIRADVLAGTPQTQQQPPKGGIGGYAAGQTGTGNYRPSLSRPIETLAKVLTVAI